MDDGEPLSLRASPAPTPPDEDLEEELKDVFKEESSSSQIKPPEVEKSDGAAADYSFVDPEDTEYDATPYSGLGFRVETPPGDWGWDKSEEEIKAERQAKMDREKPLSSSSSGGARPKVDPATVKKRQAFAQRRDSSIGAMMMVDQMDDREIRRRFRNYEI